MRRNPAQEPGPQVGYLVSWLSPGGLPPEGPTIVLVWLPGLERMARQHQGAAFERALEADPGRVLLGYMSLAVAVRSDGSPHERLCGDVYLVRGSWAQRGWGPLLYDVGIYTAMRDNREGLAPDRYTSSASAEAVWGAYLERRGDVQPRDLPPGCPRYGDRAPLDFAYTPSRGFPLGAVGQLESQMARAIKEAARLSGVSASRIPDLLVEEGMSGFMQVMAPRAVGGIEAEERVANAPKKKKKKRKFFDRPHNWAEPLVVMKDGTEITRGEICRYYMDNIDQIFPHVKGKVMVLFAPEIAMYLWKRHAPAGGWITITKKRGPDDPHSYEYWVLRKIIEFHRVIGSSSKTIWVDLDPKLGPKPELLQAKLRAAIPTVIDVMQKAYPQAEIKVWLSGKRGIHVEAYLPTAVKVDAARKKLRRSLDAAFKDDPTFTTGIPRLNQIRLDVTTLKRTGSIRAPYSMTQTGGVKQPYQPGMFARLVARVQGKRAANPEVLARRLLR